MYSRMDWSVAHKILKRFKRDASKAKQKTGQAADKILYPVKEQVRSAKVKGRRDTNRLKAWYSSEGVQYARYLKPYMAYVFIYGLLLNYTLHILLSFPLTYYTVPAWGIAYYFAKEELTEFVLTIRGMNR